MVMFVVPGVTHCHLPFQLQVLAECSTLTRITLHGCLFWLLKGSGSPVCRLFNLEPRKTRGQPALLHKFIEPHGIFKCSQLEVSRGGIFANNILLRLWAIYILLPITIPLSPEYAIHFLSTRIPLKSEVGKLQQAFWNAWEWRDQDYNFMTHF